SARDRCAPRSSRSAPARVTPTAPCQRRTHPYPRTPQCKLDVLAFGAAIIDVADRTRTLERVELRQDWLSKQREDCQRRDVVVDLLGAGGAEQDAADQRVGQSVGKRDGSRVESE